jgi:hypothetical protein
MKKLFTLLLIANVFAVNSSKAQNLPVAVNDTFYVDFADTVRTYTYNRSTITANDFLGSGTQKRIDTIFYNGVNQVSVVMHLIPTIRVDKINFTTNPGYFGKDSITYYLTDNGNPTGFDTAIIYIYVRRKSYENIDLNNINAGIDKEVLFMDRVNSFAMFEVPKGSGSNTIYASNFWLAGVDAGGQLKGYAETYALNGVNNAGPLGIGSDYNYKWDRVWKVSSTDIQNHIAGLSTTEAITNWPAHSDTILGQAQNLAPFVDVNGDGFYNPTLGDYPKIKGQQAIYFIRNSDRTPTFTIGGGFEFHGMVYAYDCPEDSAINNTLFLDYTIYNRSTFTFTDCYFGQFADFDIGNPYDDYVGCDVSRGTFYGYNGDNNDEDGSGGTGYGFFPPAQGTIFLKGVPQDADGIDNPFTTDVPTAIAQNGIPYAGLGTGFGDGTIDNEYLGLSHFVGFSKIANFSGDGDPSSVADYYNYLRGRWRDGSIMKWGGNGHFSDPNASTVNAGFLFPGTSDPLHWSATGIVPTPLEWSESSVGNTTGDRRGMGSTGPFTFNPGAVVEMELAFVFGRNYVDSGNTAGIVVMQERVDSIRSYHANGFATTPCGGSIIGVKNEAIQSNLLSIYPNPFTSQFTINYRPTSNTYVEVFNLLGNIVLTQSITQQLSWIDLSNKPNGVYFVKVTDGNKVITKKVIKQ